MEKIKIEAIIEKPKNIVWDSYTNPIHITKWNFASEDWCCPSASNDLKVGGKYKVRMEAKDGSFGFDFEALYNGIVKEEKIDYSIADGRKVEIDFQQTDPYTTKLTIDFEAENQNPIEFQKQGWQAILNNFKMYTEGLL